MGSVIQRRKKEATRSIIELVPAVATGFNSIGDSEELCRMCLRTVPSKDKRLGLNPCTSGMFHM